MKKQSAGLLVNIFLLLVVPSLHSQDEANKAIREYKEAIAGTKKTYADSIDGAREKKKREIAPAGFN